MTTTEAVTIIENEIADNLFDRGATPEQVHAHLSNPMIRRGIVLRAQHKAGTLNVAEHGVAKLRKVLNDPTAPATY